MKIFFAIIFLFFIKTYIFAQDVAYARQMLDKLTSAKMYGRGYIKNGDGKAAAFIANQFKKNKLQNFGDNYFQTYYFPMNTFPKKVEAIVDHKELIPGEEYVISRSNPSVNMKFPVSHVSVKIKNADSLFLILDSANKEQLFLFPNEHFQKLYGTTLPGVKSAAMLTEQTPYWHVKNGGKVDSTAWLKILKSAMPANAKSISIQFDNNFISAYETKNVIAYVKGKRFPDQFIILTAHYDHLGMMGQTLYPGANDNGSGTAMLLDLAKYYSLPENQPERSIAFIAFSGEEAGLKGSTYYVEHPLFPLEKIQLVINLDMIGTGSEGITIVNGELFPDIVETLEMINAENNFLPAIKTRGESCNSDHCPFYQKGVKSVFIYTMGPEHTAYHTPADNKDNFPFTAYNGLFNLLTTYIQLFN